MKNIVYYVSDHGYGHASRTIAILRFLVLEDTKIIVKTSKPLEFIKKSLNGFENIIYEYIETDVGLVLEHKSLSVNKELLKNNVNTWLKSWDEIIKNEIKSLGNRNIDLIVSDITPWAFIVSERLNIKSIAISNFTWYEMYLDILGSNKNLDKIKKAYEKADILLQLPLNLEMKSFKKIKKVGIFSREINKKSATDIKKSLSPSKKLIYIGIGKSVNKEFLNNINFNGCSKYNFLFSHGTNIKGDNIYNIPENVLEVQNYIAACDYIISKAGWSTVSESIVAGVPLLLIEREESIEDRTIIDKVCHKNLGLPISKKNLFDLNIEKKLKKLDGLNINNDFVNNSKEIAQLIYEF